MDKKAKLVSELGNEDRISKLPQPILLHILSFLDTVEVVRTSLLSTTWRHIWTQVDSFCFTSRSWSDDTEMPLLTTKLINFATRVFMLNTSSSFKRFRLTLLCPYQYSDIEPLLWTAITHNVREFEFSVARGYVQLPRFFYSLKSLQKLTLGLETDITNVPESVCLPSLKVLHLGHFGEPVNSSCLARLFSGSPTLQELVIDGSLVDTLHLQSSSLKCFEYRGMIHLSSLKCRVKNLFSIVKATLDIVMDCDGNVAENFGDQILNAKVLSLSSDILQALLAANRNLSCLPNLIDLAVTPCDCGSYHSDFLDLLQTAPNLKRLKLTRTSFGEERLILQCTKSTLGSFKFNCYRGSAEYIDAKALLAANHNLSYLPNLIELVVTLCDCGSYHPDLLKKLLTAPNLKSLTLELRPLNEEQIVPQCIKSSLEFFKFGFYRGNEEAMEILDYMLSNGKVLKVIQMLTSFPKHFRKKYEKKLLKKLAMFPHIESLLIGNLCFT